MKIIDYKYKENENKIEIIVENDYGETFQGELIKK